MQLEWWRGTGARISFPTSVPLVSFTMMRHGHLIQVLFHLVIPGFLSDFFSITIFCLAQIKLPLGLLTWEILVAIAYDLSEEPWGTATEAVMLKLIQVKNQTSLCVRSEV